MWILLKDDGSIKYDGMNEGWERAWTLRLWECQQKGEERWTKQALIDPRSVGSQSASASPACFKYKQFCVHVMMPSLTFRNQVLLSSDASLIKENLTSQVPASTHLIWCIIITTNEEASMGNEEHLWNGCCSSLTHHSNTVLSKHQKPAGLKEEQDRPSNATE